MAGHHFIMFAFSILPIKATIDVNLPELEYLSDHLHPEECRRLVAALHFKTYEQPNALDQAERKISKDIPCLKALLHWNSAVEEGKGETHEAIEHRLRQIGRIDLADWLGRTVFHQLGEDLKRNLNDSFKEFVTEKKRNYTAAPTFRLVEKLPDPTEWSAFDTICYTAAALLLFAIFIAVCTAIFKACCRRVKKQHATEHHYTPLAGDEIDEMESEYGVKENSLSTE